MRIPRHAHVAVVDGSQLRLFVNTGTPDAVELRGVRTGPVDTSNKSAGIRDRESTKARDGGRELDELAHGAGVAEYLNAEVMAGRVERLVVVADPGTLGEMRRHYHGRLKAALLGELDKTLTNSPVDAIERALEAA